MRYALEEMGAALKATRERQGLSQRELADAAGTDQARISKIESGDIDLRLSSLVNLARTLGLELVLADRRHLPAVEAILKERASDADPGRRSRVIRRIRETLQNLQRAHPDDRQLKQAMNAVAVLNMARLTEAELALLEEASGQLSDAKPEAMDQLRPRLETLIRLRNAKAHGAPDTPGQQPAYTLDDDDE
jgi:transcriptional regulator with XRE-family HTH domain